MSAKAAAVCVAASSIAGCMVKAFCWWQDLMWESITARQMGCVAICVGVARTCLIGRGDVKCSAASGLLAEQIWPAVKVLWFLTTSFTLVMKR